MSGHSKWSTIKHKKAAKDARRGKAWAKLIRQIEVAAREAGTADTEASPSLALAVQKAKDAEVPKDTIDRAAKRGAGEMGDAAAFENAQYEGYAASGVAVLVDCLTDNKNRTAGDVRNAFAKAGGNLAEPGSVAFQFTRRGQVLLAADGVAEDDVLLVGLDAGMEDLETDGDTFVAWCDPSDAGDLRAALEAGGFHVRGSGSTMVPASTVPIDEVAAAKKVLRLMDLLDDNDDVQDVYTNFDIADGLLVELEDA
jgi:YebC/PmpR family DNA-binding regulatory protein